MERLGHATRRSRRGRPLRWALVALVSVSFAAAAENRSTSVPALGIEPATSIRLAGSVEEALAFNESEQGALDAVEDGAGGLDTPALYVLLRAAAELPGEDQLLGAPTLDVAGALALPAALRGRLVSADLIVRRVTPWLGSAQTDRRGWGERPIWRLDCHERRLDLAGGVGEPLIVMVSELPDYLTEGDHPDGVKAAVYGVFYQSVRLPTERPDAAGRKTHVYPVLVARTVHGTDRAEGGNAGKVILALLLIALIVGYLFAKRSAARGEPAEGAAESDPADADAGPVDEDLVREVERHKKETNPDSPSEDV